MQARVLPRITAGLTVICLLLLLAGCGTPGGSGSQSDFTLDKREQDIPRALAHYSQGLMCEWEHSPGSKALEEFELGSKLDPASNLLRQKVAVAGLRLQRSDEAIAALRESCRRSPDSAQAWIDLAATCQWTGHPDLALQYYSTALNLAPTNAILVYLEMARLNFLLKNDSQAIKTLQKALNRADTRPLVLAFARTVCQESIAAQSYERALGCLQFVVDNMEQSEERQLSRNLLGDLYLRTGNEKEAERNFLIATKEDPPLPESFVRLACIYLEHDASKAVDTLLVADKRLPDNLVILQSLGLVYGSQKEYDKAIAAFEKARDFQERSGQEPSPAFYVTWGSTYDRAGKHEKAEEIFEKCIQLYPDAHEAMNYLAYTWAEKGVKLDKALDYVTRALELDPDNGAYIDTLGWIYFMQKKYPEALEQLKKANDIVKDDPTVTEHVGDAFHAVNDDEKAVSYWKRSFILDPTSETVAKKLESRGVKLDPLRKEAKRAEKKGKED